MSSPVVAPGGSGTSARRTRARAHFLAIIAITSILSMIDFEIVAYGVPGIAIGFDLLRLPIIFTYVAVGALGLLTLWLSVWLARQVWRVELALDMESRTDSASRAAC